MRIRTLNISAISPDDAKALAAKQMGAPPEHIAVAESTFGNYTATLLHADGEVEIEVSNDGMSAIIADAAPVKGQGRLLSFAMLGNAIRDAQIALPPDPNAAKRVVEGLARGKDVKGVVIARGIPPKPAEDARLEPIGDWRYPVYPGDAFATIVPPKEARPGKNLYGKRIMPEGNSRGKGLAIDEESGCFIDQTDLLMRSDELGVVEYEGTQIVVNPIYEVSRDGMEVRADIYPKDFKGNPITPERLQEAFQTLEFKERLDGRALATARAKAVETGMPIKDVVIIRGVKPIHGIDGWFEMLAVDERTSVGEQDTSGKIDFRARGVIRSVSSGQKLGKLHPPVKGTPGRDVYGLVIPAKDGIAFAVNCGEGVAVDATGTEFTATNQGMVFFVGNTLEVTDVFETRGDVNMATGNLDLEKGSVYVRGAVLSGFAVKSPRNILVDEVIESSEVSAAGDIEIRGGILMDKDGIVRAGGGISALFAKNATIEAQGDVDIAHESTNCIIFAGRKFIATRGRGKIIGSTIRCGEGVWANEIGSEIGVETTIFLGLERASSEELVCKRKEVGAVLQKIYGVLGTGDPRDILVRCRPEKRKAVAELLKARISAEEQLRAIEEQLEAEREAVRASASRVGIKVYKTIHPGVVINCFGSTLKVTKPLHATRVYFDPQKRHIVTGSL